VGAVGFLAQVGEDEFALLLQGHTPRSTALRSSPFHLGNHVIRSLDAGEQRRPQIGDWIV
jgi:hypothetical protein